jgi:TRAP-type C4-dicarboxylate transport system substrate-binding protein
MLAGKMDRPNQDRPKKKFREETVTKKLAARSVLFAAGLALLVARPAAAETKILFNVFTPPSSEISQKIIYPWLKEIERVTEGRVKIVIPPQNMAAPPEQMNMVKTGVADGAFMFNAFLQKSHPALQLGFLPGTMHTALADGVAYWRTYEKFIAPKHPVNEVKLLGFFANPPGHLYNMEKKPIQSIADMKGKKTWSLPGLTASAIGATGASVVPGPAVRMYEIVSKGVVDHFCCIDYGDMQAYKVLQYVGAVTEVEGGVFSPKFSVFVNTAKWNSLSPKDQAAIMKISGEALARRAGLNDEHNESVKKDYLAHGGIIVKASPEFNAALKKTWQPLFDAWIASANKEGVDGKAALAYFMSEAKKVESGK